MSYVDLDPNPTIETITQLHCDGQTDSVNKLDDAVKALSKQLWGRRVRQAIIQSQRAYLLAADILRSRVDCLFGWRPSGVLIGGTIIGAALLIASLSWVFAVVGITVGATACIGLLYYPKDSQVNINSDRLRNELGVLRSDYVNDVQNLVNLRANLADARDKQQKWAEMFKTRQLRESAQYRRQQLLNRDWKALRSVPFENYLEEVFRELEYVVETTRVTGDQGADLIVSNDGHRIVIQVKGYFSSVSNSAVQEAHTAMAHYKCNACAVITNSRFTASAKELADSVGCILIDEDTLPALIMGKCDLWQIHLSNQQNDFAQKKEAMPSVPPESRS